MSFSTLINSLTKLSSRNLNRVLSTRIWQFRINNFASLGACSVAAAIPQRVSASKNASFAPSRLFCSKISKEPDPNKEQKIQKSTEETSQFENVLTIPNLLCVTRMCLTPVLGYLVVEGVYSTAFTLFVVAGITDLLDGWIARTFPGQSSLAGSFLDPMADKLLVGTLFLSLTYVNLIPVPLTVLIVARDVFLMMGGFYIRYISLPPPKTLKRYFDVTRVTAQLAPTTISKLNTALQLVLIASTLASPLMTISPDSYLPYLWYATALTTVLSGLGYMFSKNTYKILQSQGMKKP